MKRIGIYIDLENIAHLKFNVNFKLILEDIIKFYRSNLKDKDIYYSIKKAYGDNKSIKLYEKELRDLHIDIIHSVHINKAKNMSDMISSIDAFEDFVFNKNIDIIVFVSRDVDYTIVMERLKRHGAIAAIVTTITNANRDIFQNVSNKIFKIEKYKAKENDKTNQLDEYSLEYLKFFYNRVIEVYNNNTESKKFSISDICNKVNMDFKLEQGESAIEKTYFKKIKKLFKYLIENDIDIKVDRDYFSIDDIEKLHYFFRSLD
ncbi:NYN domain-containing protein [Brachyspira pilosicoli]|uniref:NYN domain-containing protein n=1 Tax=Brachyspira pilosicoli TaxID=52584 RepID=UPI0012F529C1|nr:NYN domain-containing protein [Brachyspira pilosicoli]